MKEKKRSSRSWGTFAIAALFAVSTVCGYLGWSWYLRNTEPAPGWTDIAYLLLTLFTVNASFDLPGVPVLLDIARFLAPATLAGTIIVLAMNVFHARLTAFMVRIFFRRHAVFYGCSAGALLIAEDIVKKRRVIFLIPQGDDAPLDGIAAVGAVALAGFRSPRSAFAQAGLRRASYLFIMTSTDAATQAVSREAEEYLRSNAKYPAPTVFAGYADVFGLRMARELDEARLENGDKTGKSVNVRPFNLELQLAREIIDRHLPDTLVRLRSPLDQPVSAAIFGFGKLGQTLLFEAAQMFHFPDFRLPRISVVDRGIDEKWRDFLPRHPEIARAAEINLIESSDWRAEMEKELPILALITFQDAALALDTARALRQFAFRCPGQRPEAYGESLPVLVIVPPIGSDAGFPDRDCRRDFLEAQGIEWVDAAELLNGNDIINRAERCDALAKGIHYSWMAKPGESWKPEILESEWSLLSDIMRDSNRYAARHIAVKLRYLGWQLRPEDDPAKACDFDFEAIAPGDRELLGRMEHQRWMAEKYLAGYASTDCTDPVLCETLKQTRHLHGNLVPWEKLSAGDQLKDLNILIHAVNIAKAAGMKLARLEP